MCMLILKEEIYDINSVLNLVVGNDTDQLAAVENLTMDVIAHDDFDKLPENVQDTLYLLNNYEFENVSDSDVEEAKKIIKQYLGL